MDSHLEPYLHRLPGLFPTAMCHNNAILDLGSTQSAQIAREIRALGVYSEIHPNDITPAALKALVAQCEGGKFGARDLRRIIRKTVEDEAANRIVDGQLAAGGSLTVDAGPDGKVVIL